MESFTSAERRNRFNGYGVPHAIDVFGRRSVNTGHETRKESNMPIDHWMMFATFAEQRHFIYPSRQTYQGVIINGNMVAHAPDGLAAFILEKTDAIRYII